MTITIADVFGISLVRIPSSEFRVPNSAYLQSPHFAFLPILLTDTTSLVYSLNNPTGFPPLVCSSFGC